MNLKAYFSQPDTPSRNSPVGRLMVKVLDKNPGMSLDDARAEANRLLDKASGRENYRIPEVYSPEELKQAHERFRSLRR
jgi:hypothetical protein